MRISILFIFLFALTISNINSQVTISLNDKNYEGETNLGIFTGLQGFKLNKAELGIGLNYCTTNRLNIKNKVHDFWLRFYKPFIGPYFTPLIDLQESRVNGYRLGLSLLMLNLHLSKFKYQHKTYQLISYTISIPVFGFHLSYNHYFGKKKINNAFPRYYFAIRYFIPIVYTKKSS